MMTFPYEANGPTPESKEAIVRMTETMLAQHDKILEMNARLLQVLSAPMVMYDPQDVQMAGHP